MPFSSFRRSSPCSVVSSLIRLGGIVFCVAGLLAAITPAPARTVDGLDGIDGYGDGTDGKDASLSIAKTSTATARTDKSQYNLFNPTPDDLLRTFKSSRPDQTVGPGTVDAGHYYMEIGFFANSIQLGSTKSSSWIPLQSTHFRAGLTNTIELELIYNGLYQVTTNKLRSNGKRGDTTVSGSGDTTARLRFNLIGDDGGPFSFAIMPQVTIPTATDHIQNEHIEGGVVLPVSFKLPAGFSAILHVQPGTARNGAKNGTLFELVTGATLYHDIFRTKDRFAELYLEYFDTKDFETDGYHAQQVDVGLRVMPVKDWQLDFGCNFGVSAEAPDYQWFSGLSTRF